MSERARQKGIWNIHAKFQSNCFRNGDLSPFFLFSTKQPSKQASNQASKQATKQPSVKVRKEDRKKAIWNIHAKFLPNRFRNDDFSPFNQIDQPTQPLPL
jgi:hypothetical protein